MLLQFGIPFRTAAANIDETPTPEETPTALVARLAAAKARAVTAAPDDVVLAADTVVALAGEIFGKPADLDAARGMIRRLAGRTHQVHTGVCLLTAGDADVWVCTTDVTFKALSDDQIEAYLAVASPLDKAGAYAIQGHQALLVDHFDGSYTNVVGLPIEEVLAKMSPE